MLCCSWKSDALVWSHGNFPTALRKSHQFWPSFWSHSKMSAIPRTTWEIPRMSDCLTSVKKKNTAIYCLFSAGPPYLPKIISPDIKMFSFLPVRPSFLGSPLVMRFPTVASAHSSLLDPWSLQLSNFDGPHPLQVNAQGSYFTSNPWTLCDAYWLSHCTSVQDFRGENSPREFQVNLTRRSQ